MSRKKSVINDRETGQPSVVYDVQPLSDTKCPMQGYKGVKSFDFNKDVASIKDLPRANTVFDGTGHSLLTLTVSPMTKHPISGVFWILYPIIGIGYIEVQGGYDICLRVLVVDAVCARLSDDGQLSVHLPLDVIFAYANMEVGIDLKKNELYWKGKACYRGFDTGWRWRCAEGGGTIIRF